MIALIGAAAVRLGAETSETDLHRLIRLYSSQQIVGLNAGETFRFKLKNGTERVIRVIAVQNQRDRVVKLMRRAEVRLEIDGQPLDLICAPYVMPTETAGLRLLAESGSGWGNVSKQVQLSVWDATEPIVDTLWVKDNQGTEDVDFCQIKVFSAADPEKAMPHIFMTCNPTQEVRPDQAVTFRFWFQGRDARPLRVDFGDGTQLADYESYTAVPHRFKTPGVHVVTAQCEAHGLPIMQKLKVVVTPAPRIRG